MAFLVRKTPAEGCELYYNNTEGNRNSVVSQASCRMDVTRPENYLSNIPHGEFGGIRHLPHRWKRTVDALLDYFEGV